MKKPRKKNEAAVALGKRRQAKMTKAEREALGRKAGRARAAKLSPRRRSEIARMGAMERWRRWYAGETA